MRCLAVNSVMKNLFQDVLIFAALILGSKWLPGPACLFCLKSLMRDE